MPTNLSLDDEIAALENTSGSAAGFVTRLLALLRAGFHSTVNPFGDAATRDSWDGSGDAPASVEGQLARLNSAGKIPAAMLDVTPTPQASKTTAGLVRIWDGSGDAPADLDDGDVVPALNASGKVPDAVLPASALSVGGPPDGLFELRVTQTIDASGSSTFSRSQSMPSSDTSSGGTPIPMTDEVRDAQSAFSLHSSGDVNIPAGEYFVVGALRSQARWLLIEHTDTDGSDAVRSEQAPYYSGPTQWGQIATQFTRTADGRMRIKAGSFPGTRSIDFSHLPALPSTSGSAVFGWLRIWRIS